MPVNIHVARCMWLPPRGAQFAEISRKNRNADEEHWQEEAAEIETEQKQSQKQKQKQRQRQKLLDSSRHWRIDLVYGRQRDAIIMHPLSYAPPPTLHHPPPPPPPPPPGPSPAPAPRQVSDSYHYGACPAAPRVQHAATCPAGFDATCHAASPSLPCPPPPPTCLFFMSSATNRTRFPHE